MYSTYIGGSKGAFALKASRSSMARSWHKGNPRACARDCRKAQRDADDIYEEEPVLTTLVVEKQTVFDMQAV